jgi:hypothetical protein
MTAQGSARGTDRASLLAVLAGAVGSLGLMFRVGRHQQSFLLLALFTGWVLAPFMALIGGYIVAKRWSVVTRTTLSIVMLVVTLGSLGLYGEVAFGHARPQPAFRFLWVPLASWLLIALVPIAAAQQRRPRLHRQRSNARPD